MPPLHFGVFVFLLVSLVLSCICISISMGDGWMHPECWFTDAICSCGKWSVSNSDREKRRKRRKRKENYFLFRSSYHSVPRIFEYLFSCPGQLNRWHCQWVSESVSHFWFQRLQSNDYNQSRAEHSTAQHSTAQHSRAE